MWFALDVWSKMDRFLWSPANHGCWPQPCGCIRSISCPGSQTNRNCWISHTKGLQSEWADISIKVPWSICHSLCALLVDDLVQYCWQQWDTSSSKSCPASTPSSSQILAFQSSNSRHISSH